MQGLIKKISELPSLPYVTKDGDTLTERLDKIPTKQTRLVNPKVGNSHNVPQFDRTKLWDATCEVNKIVQKTKNNEMPWEYLSKYYPSKWGKLSTGAIPRPLELFGIMDAKSLALSVRMDNPIEFTVAAQKYLNEEGVNLKKDETEHPQHINFLEWVPNVLEDSADAIKRNLHKMFEVKYEYILPRPEHVWNHVTGLDRRLFGLYLAPNHPAYGAGHGASFAAQLKILITKYELTPKQLSVLRESAYLAAMGRTMGGVHYCVDNLMGFHLNKLIDVNVEGHEHLVKVA